MNLHHSPNDPPEVCWACVDDIVTAYLVSGTTPVDGTRCR